MSFDPANYAVGDIVKISRTVQVEQVLDDRIYAADCRSGHHRIQVVNTGTAKVEMVKRAARPKPKAGDVITGAEIGRIQWKRGTVIRCVEFPGGRAVRVAALVLFTDGKWHDVEGFAAYEFEALARDSKFEILLVA